jgi:serine/threonine protein kinase
MEAGTQVGAYRVLQQIGKGGMGTVWLAEHTMLGRRAALKLLHPMFTTRSEIVTRFFNEARAATAISDPGIVQIFDFGQHVDGTAYIAMEMLEGEPLDRRLKRMGRLPVGDALRIMRQVASTLGVAHRSGIVHRDLKPENVFLVHDPEVVGGERAKILDFGIAKLTTDTNPMTHTSAVMGTPAYMSPEQCRGAGRVDQRADIYSLGCTLFALITGGPPFDIEGSGEIIAAHLREPPPAPSSRARDIPPELDALILRCLAKDPGRRFASGTELAAALGVLIGTASSPTVSTSPSAPAHPRTGPASLTTLSAATGAPRSSPVRSSRVVAAAVATLAVGGGVTALVVTRREPARPSEPHVTLPAPSPTTEPLAEPMKQLLERFVAWSRAHAGEPCPTASALGVAHDDPWGHPIELTCTEQPGNQIAGAISGGPDGVAGTPDDVGSWQLGDDVTAGVHGPRWIAKPSIAAKPVPAEPATAASKTTPEAASPAAASKTTPEAARPGAASKTTPEAARPGAASKTTPEAGKPSPEGAQPASATKPPARSKKKPPPEDNDIPRERYR